MENRIITAMVVLFFSGIIIAVSIYGIKIWINLESEENKFKIILLKNHAIIIPVLSVVLTISVLFVLGYIFDINYMKLWLSISLKNE